MAQTPATTSNDTPPEVETAPKKHIESVGALFHRRSRRLDFVRNPYKSWAVACIFFAAVIVVVVAIDGGVAIKLKEGGFQVSAVSTPTPSPIIDKNLLINTAAAYTARSAALTLLESTTPPLADPATP